MTDSFASRPRIVPLRGGRLHAPDLLQVRARVAACGGGDAAVRSAEGVLWWMVEQLRARDDGLGRVWWTDPVELELEVCAAETGISLDEVLGADQQLVSAGLLRREERGKRRWIDADLMLEWPCLAELRALRPGEFVERDPLPAALSVFREIARRSPGTTEAPGWVSTSRAELAESSLWGTTLVSHALRALEHANVVERAPSRSLCLRLRPAAFRGYAAPEADATLRGARPRTPPATAPPAASPTEWQVPPGAEVLLAGQPVRFPTGAKIEIGSHVDRIVVDKDDTGRDLVQIGPLTIRMPRA